MSVPTVVPPSAARAAHPVSAHAPPAYRGPLQDLPRSRIGNGFNLIACPDHRDKYPCFLARTTTRETLSFTDIGGTISDPGSQPDDLLCRLSPQVRYVPRVGLIFPSIDRPQISSGTPVGD